MPRQPKIDDPVGEKGETRAELIEAAVRAGAHYNTAAEFAGIHEATFYRWMEGKGPRYREFRESITRARAAAQTRAIGTVMEAIQGGGTRTRERVKTVEGKVVERETVTETLEPDARVALEFLARTAPDRYGRRQAIEVGPPGSQGMGDPAGLGDSDARRLRRRFEAWQVARGGSPVPEAIDPPPTRYNDEDDDSIEDAVIVEDDDEGSSNG